jgi:predicted AlkP superfamily pyrophosphatase or phosphodiesterase
MRKLMLLLLMGIGLASAAEPARKPKLVLTIVVDQFRYDYLTRYRSEYRGGLNRLLTQGAVFTDAHYQHFPTVTAVGHSVILTGAMPSVSGIVGNDWYDRIAGRQVASVSDDSVTLLGGAGTAGSSPNRLLVSTVGDELKAATGGKAKVVGISMKDRAAILPSGHAADAAYWFEAKSGNFVSSTFYFPELPAWVTEFNRTSLDKYKGAEWAKGKLPTDSKLPAELLSSPFGNELLESFAEQVLTRENLGKGSVPDLLSVSFSSNDYVGHDFGPEALEVHAICTETDQALDKLFRFLDTRIGMSNILVVFAADHGVAPLPEATAGRHLPGGRMPPRIIQNTALAALAKKYGDGKWILSSPEHSLTLNQDLVQEKKLDRVEVEETVRETVLSVPHVWRVYTRSQLIRGMVGDDPISRAVFNGFFASRGADVYVLLEPYWMFGTSGTTHGTAYQYDTHVPVIFMGPGVRAGIYDDPILVNDVAPTLAAMLEIETPSGSMGRILQEILLRSPKY